MTNLFVDDDADLSLLQARNVAMLGYDDDERAHALCLRDSGVDVRVGVAPGTRQADDADADGLQAMPADEACEEADLVVLLGPEPPGLLAEVVAPSLVAGDVVVLGPAVPAEAASAVLDVPGVDVVRVVAWADGVTLRREFSLGRGVPMLAAVLADASGGAWETALAYARAIGSTRAGVHRVDDASYLDATVTAHALHAQILALVRSAYDALVADGCSPELAYLQCFRGSAEFAVDLDAGAHDAELSTPTGGTPDVSGSTFATAAAAVRSLLARAPVDRRAGSGSGLH